MQPLDGKRDPFGLRTSGMAASALPNRTFLTEAARETSLADLPSESDINPWLQAKSEVRLNIAVILQALPPTER